MAYTIVDEGSHSSMPQPFSNSNMCSADRVVVHAPAHYDAFDWLYCIGGPRSWQEIEESAIRARECGIAYTRSINTAATERAVPVRVTGCSALRVCSVRLSDHREVKNQTRPHSWGLRTTLVDRLVSFGRR